MTINRLYLFALIGFFSPLAESSEQEDYFGLSFKELMTIEITTANQEKEKLPESLAIVSVLTSTQLKRLGALNLYEALTFIPGIVLNETYLGNSVLTFRGVTPGLYNNKALFMINGHPLHEKLFGSSNLEYIPLESIERIEVVRSPSSVLYGTNAVSGVVNVITKTSDSSDNTLLLRAGSHDHYYGSLNLLDKNIHVSLGIKKDGGYPYGGTDDELGQAVNKDYENDLSNLFIDLSYQNWRFNTAYYKNKREKLGLNPIIQHGGPDHYESYYLDLHGQFHWWEGQVNLWLRYDNMEREHETERFPNPISGNEVFGENRVQRYSAEAQYKGSAFQDLQYILGISFEHDKSAPMLFIDQTDGSIHPFSSFRDEQSSNNWAFYSQAKYALNEQWVAVAGFRVEDNSDSGTGFNPRLGLNYEFYHDSYLKLLYSEAYRSPMFLEKYANIPGILQGVQDLKREKIRSFELGIDTQFLQRYSLQVTLYYLQLDDEISRRPADDGGTIYYNSQGREMHGIELALNSQLTSQLELNLNASYQEGKEGELNDAPYTAPFTFNAMLHYAIDGIWGVSFSHQYVAAKEYLTGTGEKGSVDSYHLSNLVISYNKPKYELSLYLKNIFDQDYTYPESVRRNITELPGGPGATAYLNWQYKFK